ncbi:MAG: hypothetical protein KIT72_03160 [Polyangiaceae bacterium]|nr:hypothetical protein [Polyangiaceae bacterium]MCW5789399.1 hypothetical protein [Polyangiaceae bacterium]
MATKKRIVWPETAFSRAPALGANDAVAIGRVVYQHFPHTSVPEIVKSEQLNLTSMTLNRCLAAYRVATELGEGNWEHLSFAMLRTLDSLAERQQAQVAKRASKEKWSAHQLQAEVARLNKQKKGKRRGRPALPSIVRAVNQLTSFAASPRGIGASLDSIPELTPDQAGRLRQATQALQAELRSLDSRLRQAL